MHLADRLHPPAPYVARPYRGPADHGAIVEVLAAYRAANGDTELPTVAQIDLTYANLHDCDPALDIALIEADGQVVAYTRASFEDLASGVGERRGTGAVPRLRRPSGSRARARAGT